MRLRYLGFLSLLVPVFFFFGGRGSVEAQQSRPAANGKNWSSASTWPGGKVPVKGDAVTINKDMNVVLDVTTPELRSLTIEGKLSFANNRDLELTTEWIMLHGELEIGTEASPHTRNATITLTNNVKDENVMEMGDRGIMLMGGTLNLHGNRKDSWTKLTKTAAAGSTTIEVLNAGDWKKGDSIVVASTDYDPHQAERRTISSISGKVITLDQKLEYMHYGQVTFGVDERAEVGMLSRNIHLRASADSETTFSGGHVMAMAGSTMKVSGVEFFHMGQHENLARYPIHWHLVGDTQGQYIQNSAIHDTFSRCVTVHGTNNIRVENNVAYNNVGHCYFLEDGVEHGNQYLNNLAVLTKCNTNRPCNSTNAIVGTYGGGAQGQAATDQLLPSDNTAASFWITNPDNTYRGNVSAGSEATGFWMAFSEHPTGKFEGTELAAKTWPRRIQFREFSGNVAHSNIEGLMLDRGTNAQGRFNLGGNYYLPLTDPGDTNSARLEATFKDLTIYKSRGAAIWARGENHIFDGLKIADSAIGYTHAYPGTAQFHGDYTSKVVNSLFVGESDNKGTPKTEAEMKYGRTMPRADADYPVRGYEYYDFLHSVVNTKFVNYQDNATRKAGALSYLLYTSFGISSNNSIEKLTFENAKPVYFPPIERRWSFSGEFGSFAGWNGAVFKDVDGSLGAGPNSYVVLDTGIAAAADDKDCRIEPTWGAAVCKGDLGRVTINAGAAGGGRGGAPAGPGGPGGGAPAAGRGAALAPGAAAGPGAAGQGRGGPGAAPAPGAAAGPGPAGPAGPAGAPGAGAPPRGGGAPGGAGGRGAPANPIVLSRNGRTFTTTGATNVKAGTEIKVETQSPTVSINLSELESGSWVTFELPGFTTAATGTAQNSIDALRSATSTSYYKGENALWVKVVSAGGPVGRGGRGGGGGGTVQVSK